MRLPIVALCSILLVPSPSLAWGFEAHKFISERMLALLPVELRPLFESHKSYLIERSVDPDLWRIVGWESEDPNHFVDLDYYGAFPFSELPREYDRAVQKFGVDVVREQGTLPWRTAEFYGRLQREFESLTRASPPSFATENIVLFSAIMAHYVGDAHVPLHSIINYDGQRTSQGGVHSRWESELFERNRTRLRIAPAAPEPVSDPREFMFQTLLASNQLAAGVLAADLKAAKGREFYDDVYFEIFATEQFDVMQRRLNESISAVASLIIGAWDQAGRPAIPADGARKPRPIVRPKG